jgi:hypothetical protein
MKVEYVANEQDIYDMKQIKGQEISDGNCGVFNSPKKTNYNNSPISALASKKVLYYVN